MSEHDRVTELAKRRGFFTRTAEAYGGVAGFYTYGPQGATLKATLESVWRDRFVTREGHMEIDAPTIMPEDVFEASGHLETFDDMVVDCAACGAAHRADHLIEDATDVEEAESLPTTEVADRIAAHDIVCPACGAALAGEPVEDFNLMFGTNIGPGDSSPGYLRPETAQGIFVEFPQLAEYARNQLPFGVAQIGRAYRNEISPRRGLVRVREFTQAELEHFVDPDRDEPSLEAVEDVVLPLYSAADQTTEDGGVRELTVAEALDAGVVGDPWIAYYLGVSRDWYDRVGVDMDRFRYRQHLPGELSHYASDTWDAETEIAGDWIEVTGFAYRGSHDLASHDDHSGDDYTVFRQYDEPRTVEQPTVDPDMSYLGPEYGDRAADIADELRTLAGANPEVFEGESVDVSVGGESYAVPTEAADFSIEEVTESGEHITPHVIEPSFGVDRLTYTILAHNHREDIVDGEERDYLSLPPAMAPTLVGVFPLMDRDGLGERADEITGRLRNRGFAVTYDDAGSIGRRYRRQDEIGTPYCVTVDYDTLETDTVTVRDRDTAAQRRLPAADLPDALGGLRAGERLFDSVGEPLDDD
jgi:glycyl-tRNA synthetase